MLKASFVLASQNDLSCYEGTRLTCAFGEGVIYQKFVSGFRVKLDTNEQNCILCCVA